MSYRSINFVFITLVTLFTNCDSDGKHSSVQLKNKDSVTSSLHHDITISPKDSNKLTILIRKIYKWHHVYETDEFGFEPKKKNSSDTLYTSIDFDAINVTIKKMEATGYFDNDFLANYQKIAARMDDELKTGKSTWHEGDLPPFNDDSDPWCNCQDSPHDYWDKITLKNIKIDKDQAIFNWTWGDNAYKVKAKKQAGNWQVSYLEGFDISHYNWAK